MTTEEDFRRALVENPTDFTLRLVYADWLEERGDVRAMGMRALGLNGFRPYEKYRVGMWFDEKDQVVSSPNSRRATYSDLPTDWFALLEGGTLHPRPAMRQYHNVHSDWATLDANDAAAVAFVKLPPERREELLRVPVLV